ncbi:MAG TPA: DUF2461 domain-containing protein [Cytophagaceae bacterium]|nr:DUF2461 domain-containing protein [Cytophagaceae bacterium]
MAREKLIPFLKKLKSNNNKEWFDKNRADYDMLREEMIGLMGEIVKKFGKIDTTIASTDPRKSIFRINRDVRFSKDKAPYKTNMGGYMADGGKKSPKGGYYLHLEPGNCFLAGGIWMPEPEHLKKIRQEIDYNGKELEKILKSKEFKTYFNGLSEEEKLTRVPKDFDPGSSFAEYLKLKSFVVVHPFDDKLISDPKLADYCTKVFKAVLPLNKFLNVAFD